MNRSRSSLVIGLCSAIALIIVTLLLLHFHRPLRTRGIRYLVAGTEDSIETAGDEDIHETPQEIDELEQNPTASQNTQQDAQIDGVRYSDTSSLHTLLSPEGSEVPRRTSNGTTIIVTVDEGYMFL